MGGAVAAHSTAGDGIPGLAGLLVMDVVEGGFQLFRSFSRYFRPFFLFSLYFAYFPAFAYFSLLFPVFRLFSRITPVFVLPMGFL